MAGTRLPAIIGGGGIGKRGGNEKSFCVEIAKVGGKGAGDGEG